MDDCNLQKLSVKPGKLSPEFNRNITEYNVTVASIVDKLTLDLLTSDNGASYSISGSEGSKIVNLKEGEVTDIKIEVTAEDGTSKIYFIHAKRLSSKDANLFDLKVDKGILHPAFSTDVTDYSCTLPCHVTSVKVTPVVADPKSDTFVNGSKTLEEIALCVGETRIEIDVFSPDQSNKKTYIIDVFRVPLPRYVKFMDPKKAWEFECPISLSPLYRPITIKDSHPKNTYSAPFIDSMTRTSKVDPLTGQPLPSDWRIVDREIEKSMSEQLATIPLTYGGTIQSVKFSELAGYLEKCNTIPKVEDPKDCFQKSALSVQHTIEVRKWEKQLQQVYDENNAEKLLEGAQEELKKYYASLPNTAQGYKQFNIGESPMDYLQNAIQFYATALKFKPKDANLHFQLAMVLEEKYFAEDMFGLKKENHDDVPSFNLQAKESSKEEEVLAICKLRNVEAGASVSRQLKALDEEYHHLLDTGQGGKADHVQSLYAWYSKKASQEGAAAHKVEDADNPLGQAYLKYMDALALDESKAAYNFHVGRLLVIQGNYEDAIKRLEATLCWNSNHQLGRIYLGLALSLQKEGPGVRTKECVTYLLESMEVLLTDLSKKATTFAENMRKCSLYPEDLVRPNNVYLLRGLIQLGHLLGANPTIKDAMVPQDVFHTASLLASQALPTVYQADVYKQLEWVLLEAHAALLEMLLAEKNNNQELIARRCSRLSALIFHATIPSNQQLLNLQETTCQNLVWIQPCNSHALFLLASAQLNKYENSTDKEEAKRLLNDARNSFQVSIDLQDMPVEGCTPELIKEQQWYQRKVKQEQEKVQKRAEAKGKDVIPTQGRVIAKGSSTAGRGTAVSRGRGVVVPPAKAGGAAGRGVSQTSKQGATNSGAASQGGGPTAKSSVSKLQVSNDAGTMTAKSTSGPCSGQLSEHGGHATEPNKIVPVNPKVYHPHLGLARVYRILGESKLAEEYYKNVIKMSPEVHDAYIESAELLLKTDPLAAVDVYCKFPVSKNPSFDDAYIFGEIIRILMKNEKYDDNRLAPNMITYGKILGLGALERYVKILEEKFKNKLLQMVYAGVNGKSVDDPEMQNFFKFKCWL